MAQQKRTIVAFFDDSQVFQGIAILKRQEANFLFDVFYK